MLPKCIDCKHHKLEVVAGPNKVLGKIYICYNPEFTHLVDNKFLPCEHVRGIEFYCGPTGKGFEASPKIEVTT